MGMSHGKLLGISLGKSLKNALGVGLGNKLGPAEDMVPNTLLPPVVYK